jgi:hypothetical protein
MTFLTASEVQKSIASKARGRRKWLKDSRAKAAERSGVPAATLRKFENTGEISLRQFLMLLQAYGDLSVLEQAFENPPAQSMDELIKLASKESQ